MSEHAFSAEVSLTLKVAGRDLKLSHVGPDFCILQDLDLALPNGSGDLTVRIDDHVETTPVRFQQSECGELGRITYTRIEKVNLSAATASHS